MSSKSNFGASLTSASGFNPQAYLEKFGYAAGKGLGKKEDGTTTHITVSKKDDTKGVGAREDYTKSFEKLFNQAASKEGAIKSGITFFDSEDDAPAPAVKVKDEPAAEEATPPAEETKEQRRARKEAKKLKRKQKEEEANAAAASDSDEVDAEARRKKSKHAHSSPSASPSSPAAAAPIAASPVAATAAAAPSLRMLPQSSSHFIKFSHGSRLLADSHAEVDLGGKEIRGAALGKAKKSKKEKKVKKEKSKQQERDEAEEMEARGGIGMGMGMGGLGLGAAPAAESSSSDEEDNDADSHASRSDASDHELRYISTAKPRPAASSIPRARENQTLKLGKEVAAVNGAHLYHDRSQGKMRRLEEADRAYMEMMKAKKEAANAPPARPAPVAAAAPVKAEPVVTVKTEPLLTNPLFAMPSPSPPPPNEESEEETAEQRAERKAAKKAKKEAKKAKREA